MLYIRWKLINGCLNVTGIQQQHQKHVQEARLPQRTTLVNLCYVSRGMGARKVSNRKTDLQGHSRALAMVPFDILLDFHCNNVSILHSFRDIVTYFHLLEVIYHPCTALVHLCISQHTAFEVPGSPTPKI